MFPESIGVEIDSLLALLAAAHHHQVALFEQPELPNHHFAPLIHRNAVHAAVLGQAPLPIDLKVFRINAHGMIAIGSHPILGRGYQARLRGLDKPMFGKIRRIIGSQLKTHLKTLLRLFHS